MTLAEKILAEIDGTILELLANQGKHDAIMNAFIDSELLNVKALRRAVEAIDSSCGCDHQMGGLLRARCQACAHIEDIARELGVEE